MALTREDKLILQSSSIYWLWVQFIVGCCAIALNFSILIQYIVETGSLRGILMWYSYWAIIWSSANSLVWTASICFHLLLYYLKKYIPIGNSLTWYFVTFYRIRDAFLIVGMMQSLISHVAFWITWSAGRWVITYPSIAGHSVIWPGYAVQLLMTTVFVSWWHLLYGLYYLACYFCFHFWMYYNGGFWVYDALNPNQDHPYWVILIGVITTGLILNYFAISFLNDLKNRLYSIIIRYKWINLTTFDLNPSRGLWKCEHYRTQLFLSQSVISFLLAFALMMLFVAIYSTSYIVHLLITMFYLSIELTCSIWNFQHILIEPQKDSDNSNTFPIVLWFNVVSFGSITLAWIASLVGMIWYLGTDGVWVYFIFFTIYCLIYLVKFVQYYMVLTYADFHELYSQKRDLHQKDEILCETYFG